MPHQTAKPPQGCGVGRLLNSLECLAASNDLEIKASPAKLQDFRAVWIARRARISTAAAALLSPLLFSGGAGDE
jgi:hypothetical protein